MWWGGYEFAKEMQLQIQKWRGIFQADFGVVEDHLLNRTRSLNSGKIPAQDTNLLQT